MLPLVAMAGDIKYTRPVLTLKNDTLTIEFSMSVEEVRVNSEQTYAFTPVLREGKNYYAMPPVVVTGKNGDYKMRRQERKMARRFGFDNPFVVIHGRQENREDVVRYKTSVPYQAWMDHASMILLQEGKECCEVDLLDITVIEPDVAVETPALPVELEVCDPCKEMVSFLTPKEEPLKVRSEQSTLYIEFPVGKTAFDANYKNNRSELQKMKEILDPLEDGDLVTFKSINVCGYSSPDGSVRTNDRVATQRAESFALNLKGGYNFPKEVLHVTSAGEDWETLVKMLEEDQPAYAEKALAVIQKYDNLDVREARLKSTPDILIADEVLSVGDFLFQQKCEKRMKELMAGGTTVILVSHSIEQIERMCSKVAWLSHGHLKMNGDTMTVCNAYKAVQRGEA